MSASAMRTIQLVLGRRKDPLSEVVRERDALRRQQEALEEMRLELGERVSAIREHERELGNALGRAKRGQSITAPLPGLVEGANGDDGRERALDARAGQIEQRERSLAERESALARTPASGRAASTDEIERMLHDLEQRERALAERAAALTTSAKPGSQEERLARVEVRLAELHQAEQVFLRTQKELAQQAEQISLRERALRRLEQDLDDRRGQRLAPAGPDDIEERVRRLEHERAVEDTQGFSGGFRDLERRGTRRPGNGE